MLKNTIVILVFISCLFPVLLFAADALPGEYIPPSDLVEGNIKGTDVTVAVEVVDTVKEKIISSDRGPGYIIYRVRARVFRSYWGDFESGDEIVYRYLVEAGIHPLQLETRHIVSLKKKERDFIVPDMGYSFPYSDRLDALYQEVAAGVVR